MEENPYQSPEAPTEPEPPRQLVRRGDELEIRFQLTLDDLVNYNWHCIRNAKSMRWQYYLMWLGLPGVLLLAAIPLAWFSLIFSVVFAIFGIVILATWPRRYRAAVSGNARRMYSAGENRGLKEVQTLILSPEAIHTKNPLEEITRKWAVVERMEGTDDYFYIFISSISAYIIPRRVFASDDDYQEFVDTAHKYWRGIASTAGQGSPP